MDQLSVWSELISQVYIHVTDCADCTEEPCDAIMPLVALEANAWLGAYAKERS